MRAFGLILILFATPLGAAKYECVAREICQGNVCNAGTDVFIVEIGDTGVAVLSDEIGQVVMTDQGAGMYLTPLFGPQQSLEFDPRTRLAKRRLPVLVKGTHPVIHIGFCKGDGG
ncbi:MAG: hypothetical protein P8P66_03205 [Paracoccaceae bacterium]|jgi:hypothetical protein|nr:hypothetical protein [Paracoccaceae bacterium]MDG2453606.1 hypothetical protein [Paracoccaceae bacterium]